MDKKKTLYDNDNKRYVLNRRDIVVIDVDVCYKIIYETLLAKQGLSELVQKVQDLIDASVFFVWITGDIEACEVADKEKVKLCSDRVDLKTYLQFKENKIGDQMYKLGEAKYAVVMAVEHENSIVGYSVIVFDSLSKEKEISEINKILKQAIEIYLKDENIRFIDGITLEQQIFMRALMNGDVDANQILEKYLPSKYLLALVRENAFEKNDGSQIRQIQNIWKKSLFLIWEKKLYILFCDLNIAKSVEITEKMNAIAEGVYASEVFADLSGCRHKKEIIERMCLIGVKDTESNSFSDIIYSYATSILQQAGIKDYSLQLLLQKDKENNTELYETLKMYFLCENNVMKTASKLFIHRNTLVYRLNQIREITGKDINDYQVSRELLSLMMINDTAKKIEEKSDEISTRFTGDI